MTLFEIVLAGFVLWALFRSRLAGYGEGAQANAPVVVAACACLGAIVFVLALWQWRLRPVARLRILLVGFGSLVWCFCALGWYDIAVASSRMPKSALHDWASEQSLAAGVALAALVSGVAIIAVLLWLEWRRLKARRQAVTMNSVQ